MAEGVCDWALEIATIKDQIKPMGTSVQAAVNHWQTPSRRCMFSFPAQTCLHTKRLHNSLRVWHDVCAFCYSIGLYTPCFPPQQHLCSTNPDWIVIAFLVYQIGTFPHTHIPNCVLDMHFPCVFHSIYWDWWVLFMEACGSLYKERRWLTGWDCRISPVTWTGSQNRRFSLNTVFSNKNKFQPNITTAEL